LRTALLLLLTLAAGAQPLVQELSPAESGPLVASLVGTAFAGHDGCIDLAHWVRLLRVNGRLHALALHQVNLHGGSSSWKHYLWTGSRWVVRGPGLPDPARGDDVLAPSPEVEEVRLHFAALVSGLGLGEWPVSLQRQFLDARKIQEVNH